MKPLTPEQEEELRETAMNLSHDSEYKEKVKKMSIEEIVGMMKLNGFEFEEE